MLHLQAGVHFQEEEVVAVDEKLDGSHALVVDRAGDGDGRLPHALPRRRRDQYRRCLLDDLLVSPLHRALTVEEVDGRAVAVADDLHLDMARRGEVPLEKDLVGTEGRPRLTLARCDGLEQGIGTSDEPHAAATPARGRLDEQRKADGIARPRQLPGDAPGGTATLGRTGTPAAATVSLARTLWPITRMDAGVGPIQVSDAAAQASARTGFSERNP